MDNLQKQLCKQETGYDEQQLLTDIYLYLKNEYVAKTHCNGEYVTVELLNGQKFKITVSEV